MRTRIIYIALSALFLLTAAVPALAGSRFGSTWEATVSVRYGEDMTHLTIGGDTTGTAGYENLWEMRAELGGDLQAYFNHPEWGRATPYFWSDIRGLSLPDEWNFYVSYIYTDRTVDLYWDLSDAPDTIELTLVDEYNGTTVDMRTRSSYVYTNESTAARSFRVMVSGYVDGGGEPPPPPPDPGDDTTPPETTITSGVPEFTGSPDITIDYTGTDDVSAAGALEFSYSVDAGNWSAWSPGTSASITGLSDGAHTFAVKARDEAGNVDPTPAEASFTVDTTPPALTLNQPNPSRLWPPNGEMVTVSFSGNAQDSGLDTVTYTMIDEYGEYGSSGTVTPLSSDYFSFNLSVESDRNPSDRDGRTYTVTVTAADMGGSETVRTVTVKVTRKK
ncbi:MAG: Ig-like domain-containing protein [Planctomycetota bacterium]|jgi:hypothetical protein